MNRCIICDAEFEPNTLTRIWRDSFCTDKCKEKYYNKDERMNKLEKQIKVMQHFADGGEVEYHNDKSKTTFEELV